MTLRHLDRYLEEPVERVGRMLPLAAVLQRLATVHLVGADNAVGVLSPRLFERIDDL